LPTGNRTLKGNRRRAIFDRLIVPENGFTLPPPIRIIPIELPSVDVGQKCNIFYVIIYEISISYEGNPQKFIHRIKFSDIVGDPVSTAKLDEGYTYTTPQGETLLVKWHLSNDRAKQGLIVHNVKATGTSFYEPNWGQVFGVGMEWLSCDGSQGGTIWANSHIGNTTHTGSKEDGTFSFNENVWTNSLPDYSPNAIRPGVMLGNPEPEKSLLLMGRGLPLQVYPALGELGQGCIFGFNVNVMKNVQVKPPIPTFLKFTGAATARADAVSVTWRKDELHVGSTRVGMMVLETGIMGETRPVFPPDGQGVMLVSDPTDAQTGGGNITTINFSNAPESGVTKILLLLLECDSTGNPIYTLDYIGNVWNWSSSTGSYSQEAYVGVLPYPEIIKQECAGVDSWQVLNP
jgi:hypothetical protein